MSYMIGIPGCLRFLSTAVSLRKPLPSFATLLIALNSSSPRCFARNTVPLLPLPITRHI